MKRYIAFFAIMAATAIITTIVGLQIFGKPAKLLSPLPDGADCIQLNIEVNPDQSGYIERNNNNEKTNTTEPTTKPVQGTSGKSTSATELRQSDNEIVEASYYTTEYCERFNPSCLTASGDVFTNEGLTAACANRFKLGTRILLTSENGSVTVTCNDRGSFSEKYARTFDLTPTAFSKLSPLSKGVVKVAYRVLE